jgi:hypothetical protein
MYSLSKTALLRMIDEILDKINPDIRHPHVWIGAIAAGVMANPEPNPWRIGDKVALNPQPLPPGPSERAALGVYLARTIIDQANAQLRTALAVSASDASERIAGVVGSQVTDEVDFVCGNGRRPWPLPWPWPPQFAAGEITPVDLLFAGAQFQSFAGRIEGHPLQGAFSKAADTLFATAVARLDGQRSA